MADHDPGGKSRLKRSPRRLPICSATVEILGSHWPQTATIWAGFCWDRAELRETSTLMQMVCGGQNVPPDHHLNVPWAHIDDPPWEEGDSWYRVRAKDERYRFAKAGNGNWILELVTGDARK